MALNNSTLGLHADIGTATPLFPTVNDRAVSVIYLYNSHSAPVTVDLYAVPAGSTLGNEHKIYGALTITANDTFIVDTEKMIMADGDALYASATEADVVRATVSYIEI